MDRLSIFKQELSYIRNPRIRRFTEMAIELLPEYFFSVPASSTGKYHPDYALGEGGLVRHTKAAVRIAVELFRMECFNYTEDEKDMIIASLILHDGCKFGLEESRYTVTEHPLFVTMLIRENKDVTDCVTKDELNMILGNIESHMGQWCYDYKTKKQVLPKPMTKMQNFVHWCDYLASRKCLEFNFNVSVVRE